MNSNYYKKREQEYQEKMNRMIYKKSEYIAMILEEQKQMALDMIDKLFEDYSKDYVLDKKMLQMQASKFDVQEFSKRAKKIVESKDMSYSANYKMRMYDVTQKISRLELLLNQLNLELLETNEDTTASMNDILSDVRKKELERQANLFNMSNQQIKNVNKVLSNQWLRGTEFSQAWGNDLSNLYNILDTSIKRAVTYGKHPYEMKNIINKEFKTIDNWSKRILITEATHVQSKVQYESFKASGFKYFKFIAEATACDKCKPFDDRIYPLSDFEKMFMVPPIHPYCRCSLVPATEEEYQEQLAMDKERERKANEKLRIKNKGKTNSSFISDNAKDMMAKAWGQQYADDFLKLFDTLPKNDIRVKAYRDGINKLEFEKLASNSTIARHLDGTIRLNKRSFIGDNGSKPFEVVLHEFGHGMDGIGMKKYLDDENGRLRTGGIIKRGGKRYYEVTNILSGHPDYNDVLKESIMKETWHAIHGKDYPMKNDISLKERRATNWEREGARLRDEFLTEWNKKPDILKSSFSDILDSTGYLGSYPLGWGHGKAYYKQYGKREAEFVAHYFEALVDKEKQEILNKFYPETIKEVEKMLREVF